MQLLLSQYSGLKDVVVQTAMAGRVASELEPLIGWFANGAAVRTKLDGDSSSFPLCSISLYVTLTWKCSDPGERLSMPLQPSQVCAHQVRLMGDCKCQHTLHKIVMSRPTISEPVPLSVKKQRVSSALCAITPHSTFLRATSLQPNKQRHARR